MKRERNPCVYILSSGPRGTLYIGVTSDLMARLWQHREEALSGFTKRHSIKRLVWFEMHGDMEAAILREKQLKNWHRPWKLNLVEASNPQMGGPGDRARLRARRSAREAKWTLKQVQGDERSVSGREPA